MPKGSLRQESPGARAHGKGRQQKHTRCHRGFGGTNPRASCRGNEVAGTTTKRPARGTTGEHAQGKRVVLTDAARAIGKANRAPAASERKGFKEGCHAHAPHPRDGVKQVAPGQYINPAGRLEPKGSKQMATGTLLRASDLRWRSREATRPYARRPHYEEGAAPDRPARAITPPSQPSCVEKQQCRQT